MTLPDSPKQENSESSASEPSASEPSDPQTLPSTTVLFQVSLISIWVKIASLGFPATALSIIHSTLS